MKYTTDKQCLPLEQLIFKKVRLKVDGGVENIWVKVDEKNKKMYLQNNSISFAPYTSWGLVLDSTKLLLADNSIDVSYLRKESPDDTILPLHFESYNSLRTQKLIDFKGNVTQLYLDELNKLNNQLEILESQEGESISDKPQD